MRLVQLQLPLRAAASGCFRAAALTLSWTAHRPELPSAPRNLDDAGRTVAGRRNASVKSQGAYRIPNKKTRPKHMGAKKSGEEYVIPGNIIYKQRGTIWFPGENTIMGRDHTIHAAVTGYVKYYRDPARHPKRQFIGVAFNRDDKLPYPAHGVRRRKLNKVAVTRRDPTPIATVSPSGLPTRVIRKEGPAPTPEELANPPTRTGAAKVQHAISIRRTNRVLLLQKDYSYRESNVAIGKLMGKHRGKTPGLVRPGSRTGRMRARRLNREKELQQIKAIRVADKAAKKEAKRKAEAAAVKLAARTAAAAAKAAKKAAEGKTANAKAGEVGGGTGPSDLKE